jgi:hypothetical protein
MNRQNSPWLLNRMRGEFIFIDTPVNVGSCDLALGVLARLFPLAAGDAQADTSFLPPPNIRKDEWLCLRTRRIAGWSPGGPCS